MTDRELLQLAARAAGIKLEWNDAGQSGYWSQWRGLPQWEAWSSLHDSGDALDLAVALDINISPGQTLVNVQWWRRPELIELDADQEPHAGDAAAATRRVITRAAAEIGRAGGGG